MCVCMCICEYVYDMYVYVYMLSIHWGICIWYIFIYFKDMLCLLLMHDYRVGTLFEDSLLHPTFWIILYKLMYWRCPDFNWGPHRQIDMKEQIEKHGDNISASFLSPRVPSPFSFHIPLDISRRFWVNHFPQLNILHGKITPGPALCRSV